MIECIKYRDVCFLNSQKEIHATCLERRCCEIIETKLKDTWEPTAFPVVNVLKRFGCCDDIFKEPSAFGRSTTD